MEERDKSPYAAAGSSAEKDRTVPGEMVEDPHPGSISDGVDPEAREVKPPKSHRDIKDNR